MDNQFTIDVLDKGGHNDLIVRFYDLLDLCLDTYYFILAIEPEDSYQTIKIAVAKLLSYWQTNLEGIKIGQTLYLPIDFSDQYTGCFKVDYQSDALLVTYGFSEVGGYSINPIDPQDFCIAIADFEQTTDKEIKIDKANFIHAITQQIDRLKNDS